MNVVEKARIARTAGSADFDRFRLRSFVEGLAGTGELETHDKPTELADIAAILDDNAKAVRITTPAGKRITLDEKANVITVEDDNKNVVTLDKDGITLNSGGDVTIEATGKVVIKGQTVDVK